jgi:tetratricopeptide (TPR) repeat protein
MTRTPAALAALALAACASSGGAGPASPAPAPRAAREVPLPAPPRGGEPSAQARRLFAEGVAAAEQQRKLKIADWELLGRKWRAAAEPDEIAEAWFNLGVCLERQGRRAEAGDAYARALALAPGFREAAANRALLAEPEDPRAATAAWQDFLRRFPEDALARTRLAALAEQAGLQDDAVRLAREALLRDPGSAGAARLLLRVALARRNLDLAWLLALRLQKVDPQDPEAPTAMGRVLAARGEDVAAVAQWRRALELRADHAPARAELLRDALAKQRWAGAAEEAQALLREDPGDARLELIMGAALRHGGEAEKAAAAYDRAERLAQGRLPEVHLARAVLLARVQDRCEPALEELRRYAAAAGPAALVEGPAGKLERECLQVLAASKAAEEEARRMKAEAERAAPKGK